MSNPEGHGNTEYHHGARPEQKPILETTRHYEHKPLSQEQAHKEIESARKEALGKAVEEKQYRQSNKQEMQPTQPATMSGHALKQGFSKTMSRVRVEMPAPQRAFSRLIHNPTIEKTSDIIGSTVARPDAILSGSIFAFIFTAVLYFTAKYYGFALSGSETILAFVLGWLFGLIFDLIKSVLKSRR